MRFKREKSLFVRTQEVAKRLLKPSWVKRYYAGNEIAAATALSEKFGFTDRISYMKDLCRHLQLYSDETTFLNELLKVHESMIEKMRSDLASCEITDNPSLTPHLAFGTDQRLGTYGDCFRQAYYFNSDHPPPDAVLIHGTIGMSTFGSLIWHGWVEIANDVIFDGVLQRFYRKDGYYQTRTAVPCFSFSKDAAFLMNCKYGHYGPWNDVDINNAPENQS